MKAALKVLSIAAALTVLQLGTASDWSMTRMLDASGGDPMPDCTGDKVKLFCTSESGFTCNTFKFGYAAQNGPNGKTYQVGAAKEMCSNNIAVCYPTGYIEAIQGCTPKPLPE